MGKGIESRKENYGEMPLLRTLLRPKMWALQWILVIKVLFFNTTRNQIFGSRKDWGCLTLPLVQSLGTKALLGRTYNGKQHKTKYQMKGSLCQNNLNKRSLPPPAPPRKYKKEGSKDKLLPSLVLQFPQFFCCPCSKGFCFVSLRSPSFS